MKVTELMTDLAWLEGVAAGLPNSKTKRVILSKLADLLARVSRRETRPCKVCEREMVIGVGAYNGKREFCSPACKQIDHRARVAEAKELRAAGMSVVKIAKELGTTAAAVNRWLTKKK